MEDEPNEESNSSAKRSKLNNESTIESQISASNSLNSDNGGSTTEPVPSSSKADQNDSSLAKGDNGQDGNKSTSKKPLFNSTNKLKVSKRNYRARRNIGFSSSSSSDSSSSSSTSSTDSSSSSSENEEEEHKETTFRLRSHRRRRPQPVTTEEETQSSVMNRELSDRISSEINDTTTNDSDGDSNNNNLDFNDEDDDDDDGLDSESSMSDRTTPELIRPKVNIDFLSNPKPKYTFHAVPDIMNRESGLSSIRRRNLGWRPHFFQHKVASCRHTVEKLELMYKLKGHDGCVNSLNFKRSGQLLVSGSDDLKIMLWRWASNEMVYQFDSQHHSNVFQTKFLETGTNGIHIISSARDGQVKHHELPSSGATPITTVIIKHTGAVHKIALPDLYPFEVLTAGEDGHVVRCDLRENVNEKLITVKGKRSRVPLYSIASHPFKPEFCVSGQDQFVRVYDKRYIKSAPLMTFCPTHLLNKSSGRHNSYITCAVYNYLGNEILASYSEDNIYLYDTNDSTPGSFLQKFQGHQNSCTIKGVNFFGAQSEFIMSGSDCGNCFFWDKQNQAIIQWMPGDEGGVVNVLEPHPSFPFLATSGIDSDVKIWVPSSEEVPTLKDLKKCVQKNMEDRTSASGDVLENEIITFFMRQCMRRGGTNSTDSRNESPTEANLVSSDSEDDFDNSTNVKLRALPCAPS